VCPYQVYGCWFYALTPPHERGTGMLVNTGRLLVVRSKMRLSEICQKAGYRRMKLLPSEIAPAPWWISNPARGKGLDMFVSLPDNHMPSCAHALGYDSVLMRW
jgi:hypothetical protein